jgi:vacuolar-type H+-ATPase subunit B/Vma2
MEEQKKVKKGQTYPSSIGGVDYVEYQLTWILKKKLKSKTTEQIEKLKKKYLKYINAYDSELLSRENEKKLKEEQTQNAEKALLEELLKKYNKTTQSS